MSRILDDITAFLSRGISFSLLGIPVSVRVVFLVFLALVALSVQTFLPLAALWFAAALVCILVHDVGHALASRGLGYRPRISLSVMGGTTFGGGSFMTWRDAALISLAGPAAGLALAGAAALARTQVGGMPALPALALGDIESVSLGWALISLLPIRPLDGGTALEAILAGARVPSPARVTRIVSIITAFGFALLAAAAGSLWLTLALSLMGYQNAAELRGQPGLDVFRPS